MSEFDPNQPPDEQPVEHLKDQISSLKSERDRLTFVLNAIPDFVAYVDKNLIYRFCNEIYSTETGKPLSAFTGKNVIEFIGQQGLNKIQPYVDRVLSGEFVTYNDRIDYKHKSQQDVEVMYIPDVSADDEVKGFAVYVKNITAQRQAEEVLRRQALYDPLTDLPNRNYFTKRLNQAISRADRNTHQLAILFIDLDGFKQVNDELGHYTGDQVLQDVAKNLQNQLREADTLARVGGDEFVLLLEDLKDIEHVEKLANKLIASIASLDSFALEKVNIGASIGVSFYPDHGTETHQLIIHADQAMYAAKKLGKNRFSIYNKENA